MKVRRITIRNFRGVSDGEVRLGDNTLLVGGNNVGKSTVCEALDLVLGLERLNRRPVVDEHDFHLGVYLEDDGALREIRIEAILIDLPEDARIRFGGHLRRWDDRSFEFVDEEPGGTERADEEGVVWALPLTFIGRYDAEEDDFVGDTFFSHPVETDGLTDEELATLGAGLSTFTRRDKRFCGFVYLRALRTGSRALSLQRGSLLEAILKLGGEGAAEMWKDTLATLRTLDPAIGDIEQLKAIRGDMRERLARFVNLAPGEESAAFFASDLTRAHLREVVRLFIATQPSEHLVPYGKQGTGSINLLVFALLTLIADLKGNRSVIFAMEEPEIALPPHTQRRVTRFVLKEMGQSIVTSHSPYVIEQFEPADVVMLSRTGVGEMTGEPIGSSGIDRKKYRTQRRQFAEAILSRGVLVVEGSTEAAVLPAVSSALEGFRPGYTHFDLAGVSIFTADGDGDVPRYGPIFAGLGKQAFAVFDEPSAELSEDATAQLASYDQHWQSPEKGIEKLLVKQTPTSTLRRFLEDVSARADYPKGDKFAYDEDLEDGAVDDLAYLVLKVRKGEGWGYAAMLIEHCESEKEIPKFLRKIVLAIDEAMSTASELGDGVPASDEA